MNAIGLSQLNGWVKQTLKDRFTEALWLVAEIADLKENRSGHCYLELVEKREGDDAVIASARATIWAFTYRTLKPYFETTAGKSLQKGMKVLMAVEVVFHELYGFSLNVRDIDPTFTVGDLERKKREILDRLQREGVIDMNRELSFPLLPKHVAVISSPTAAGYGDFIDQLHRNPYGYVFHTKLFPAVMQGEGTTGSVIEALERIYAFESLFDVVVIIRGGGSQTDLGSFDTYELAVNVAQFPLPVIAGIGHERDETIVDRVAYRSVKTPTAAAAFLLALFQEREAELEEFRECFIQGVADLLREENKRQLLLMTSFKQQTRSVFERQTNRLMMRSQQTERNAILLTRNRLNELRQLRQRMVNRLEIKLDKSRNRLNESFGDAERLSKQLLSKQQHLLEVYETTLRFADPKKVLERGFSITRVNGKAVKDISGLKEGEIIETEFVRGNVFSEVKEIMENVGTAGDAGTSGDVIETNRV